MMLYASNRVSREQALLLIIQAYIKTVPVPLSFYAIKETDPEEGAILYYQFLGRPRSHRKWLYAVKVDEGWTLQLCVPAEYVGAAVEAELVSVDELPIGQAYLGAPAMINENLKEQRVNDE